CGHDGETVPVAGVDPARFMTSPGAALGPQCRLSPTRTWPRPSAVVSGVDDGCGTCLLRSGAVVLDDGAPRGRVGLGGEVRVVRGDGGDIETRLPQDPVDGDGRRVHPRGR